MGSGHSPELHLVECQLPAKIFLMSDMYLDFQNGWPLGFLLPYDVNEPDKYLIIYCLPELPTLSFLSKFLWKLCLSTCN